jgi:isopenicillin N synthase-like dioxygenase
MTMLDQILADGYAKVRLAPSNADRLVTLYRVAAEFFARDTDTKRRYSTPNLSTGYRPHGASHSGYADKPDQNDSFLYWTPSYKVPPNDHEISGFLAACEAYRQVVAQITAELIDDLRKRYSSDAQTPFEKASVLQINSYAELSDDELLQQPHEDADFLTVIWGSEPGLELVIGGAAQPLDLPADEVAVMPGSVLTAMTGGEIPPQDHLVRNHRTVGRKSIMYFVSPDVDSPIKPFVMNDYNLSMDIRQLVVENPQTRFGLTSDFLAQ